MVAIIRLRKGTRDHAVYLRGEKIPFRSQKAALTFTAKLVKLGIVTTVHHMAR